MADKKFENKINSVNKIDPFKSVNKINPFKEQKEKPVERRNKRNIVIAVSIFVGILLMLFVIQPAILGLGVYDDVEPVDILTLEDKINLLSQQLQERDSQLSTQLTAELTNQLLQGLDQKSAELDNLAVCLEEKSSLSAEKGLYEKNIDSLKSELNDKENQLIEVQNDHERVAELETELEDLKISYEGLIDNMAHNICCKQKVDNQNINFYSIADDKVTCQETEGTALSCFS